MVGWFLVSEVGKRIKVIEAILQKGLQVREIGGAGEFKRHNTACEAVCNNNWLWGDLNGYFGFLLLLDHGAAFSISSRFAMSENHCNSLQEVVGCAAGDMGLAPPWCRVKLQECVLEVIVQFHDSCLIAASVAVIRRRENCHHLTLMAPREVVKQEGNIRQSPMIQDRTLTNYSPP